MSGEDHQSAIFELVQFLEPRTRIDVRRSAIAYIIGVSAADEGPQLFKKEDFALGRALCLLFESTPEDRSPLLSALTNIASVDDVCANYIIEKSDVVTICVRSCRDRENIATFAAKLLSNLSLHFASKVFERAVKVWESFVSDIVALLNASDSGDFVDYMGYVLVNCTAMPRVRRLICERHLASILPMVTQNSSPNRRLIAVDIVRNLCFDDAAVPVFKKAPGTILQDASFEMEVVLPQQFAVRVLSVRRIFKYVSALLNASDSGDFVDYMGYVLVNCTAMPRVRRLICERHLASILPMVTQNSSPNRRLIAVDIVRNLCFDDGYIAMFGAKNFPHILFEVERNPFLLMSVPIMLGKRISSQVGAPHGGEIQAGIALTFRDSGNFHAFSAVGA
uniref:Protein HGH1 homolog n=1 Tax=Ascaris lumbricoides TaxID=6252 RepID=A0A0M3HSD0_ASCLU